MAEDILQTIVAQKRIEVARQMEALPISALEKRVLTLGIEKRRSMKASLATSSTGIISEFKRRSPSKGWIKRDANVADVVSGYQSAGASALSILTDVDFFGGTLADVEEARPLVDIPILRKDFVVSRYQLLQAKAVGADTVLLIASVLSRKECREFAAEAHALGLEVLLEMHSDDELDYVDEYTDMAGINNRNLGTFHTDVANSFRLADKLPRDVVRVSESGITNAETIKQLHAAGFQGFLIGEAFMRQDAPAEALAEFIKGLMS